MTRRSLIFRGAFLALGAVLAACAPTALVLPTAVEGGPEDDPAEVALTVSAAASVQDALIDIQQAYRAQSPAVAVTYNFGSSGALAQQVAQGAPVDVFLSASPQWMDDLADRDLLVPGSRQNLLHNSLVLIAPRAGDGPAGFTALPDAAVKRVAMGEPASVPAGRYGQQVLTHLGLFEDLQPKLVFAKDVRQVLAYVATGNVDAGLVYATDARLSDRVQVVAAAPGAAHEPIVYPVAVVQASDQPAAAQAFVDFLASETAADIFASYGFTMAD